MADIALINRIGVAHLRKAQPREHRRARMGGRPPQLHRREVGGAGVLGAAVPVADVLPEVPEAGGEGRLDERAP